MADDDDGSKKQTFHQNAQEARQRAPEAQTEHRFPVRPTGIVEVPIGSRGPRSLYIRRNGDSFGFTLRHFIIYPPELLSDNDGRHEAVGALLAPMETIFVKQVAERGPAGRAGLQRGDRLLCVNGAPVANLTYQQVVQRIQTGPQFLHLLVVPKEEDVLQKYFSETAHNPLSNRTQRDSSEERRKLFVQQQRSTQQPGEFRVDALSWRSLQNQNYHSLDYGRLAPRRHASVQHQQKSADDIYSSVNIYSSVPQKSAEDIYSAVQKKNYRVQQQQQQQQQKSADNIYYSSLKDFTRKQEEDIYSTPSDGYYLYETYAEPVINDHTQRPRAQPQVPLYRKSAGGGRRASESEDLSIEMKNYPGCRLSLDAGGGRRESSSSLASSLADGMSKDSLSSLDSSSTLTGQDDDSVVMCRLRKSLQEKEEFLRRPSVSMGVQPEMKQREFYGRPKKLEMPVWPPNDRESSPSRTTSAKPTHQSFQRVKEDIETEREITQDNQKAAKKDWPFGPGLGRIQESNGDVNGESEDKRNYPPNIQMVSKRARQFELGELTPEDRTSFYRSELSRLSEKRAAPNVAVRTREFESLSEARRDALRRTYRDSRSLDSSGSNCSLSSCTTERRLPGNFGIPIGSKFIHCPPPSDPAATDIPNEKHRNGERMRARSNSTSDADRRTSEQTAKTGQDLTETTPQIPEPVERLQAAPPDTSTLSPPVQQAAVRPTRLDLGGAPKRPSRQPKGAPMSQSNQQPVCDDKPLVVRRTKNTNLNEDRVTRRESYLKATEGGGLHLETGEFSDGDVSPQVLRSGHRRWRPPLFPGDIQALRKLFEETASSLGGSVSGGSSSSVSLEREKNTGSPCEKEKPAQFVREGPLHCKITEIDGKRSTDRSWKQVWAVLRGPRLFFYKDRHHQSPEVADQSLASGVDMRGSCVQVAEDYTKRKHVLRVSSVLPCRSELLLQADNTVDLAEWVQALQEQVASSTDSETKLDQVGKQQAVPQTIPATTSIQVPSNKTKNTTLRNRSPTGQSPVSKTRKPSQVNDPSTSPKSKTWKGRVVKQFRKIQGASSPSSPTAPDGSTFGVPLEHCLPALYNQFVPRLVETCTEIVENRGLEIVGIYRVPGNNAAVSALTEEVNRCYDEVTRIDQRWNDVHVVSSLLKSFFRKMPDSLLTTAAYPLFIEADKIDDPNRRLAEIKHLVKGLPPHHYNTLRHLILHLKNVVDHSASNKMEARNLAIVFGPTIVSPVEDNMQKMVDDMTHQCKIVESLLLHADWFFAEDETETLALPAPIPSGEIFSNENEVNRVLRDNITKVEGLNPAHKEKKELLQSLFSAAHRKYKRKTKTGIDVKDEPVSPKGHKDFSEAFGDGSSCSDLKDSTNESKAPVIPTTVAEMEKSSQFFNYKTGSEELKRRVESFIQETQSNLQRTSRKPECSSNNSLELRLPSSSSSPNNNLRHSLPAHQHLEHSAIQKTQSASNVFARNHNAARNVSSSPSNRNFGRAVQGDRNKPDSASDVSTTSSYDFTSRMRPFGMRRGSSAEDLVSASIEALKNLKKIKYENDTESLHKTASLDSLNKLQPSLDDDGDLVSTITKIFDEKNKEMNKIPFADESPEKTKTPHSSYLNKEKENIPASPKSYRNPSLHKNNQYSVAAVKTSQKLKERNEKLPEKDEDSSLIYSQPDNERDFLNLLPSGCVKLSSLDNIVKFSPQLTGNVNLPLMESVKLKRSESLNKPEREKPFAVRRSESLNKTGDRLKRSDSLTKNEKTESNLTKKREIRKSTLGKDFGKLKRKNGMPERSIKRRHTVGGTKDPDKVNLLDNRCQEERERSESAKERSLRTSSPDLRRRERLYCALKRQSFPESGVYKVPLESHV